MMIISLLLPLLFLLQLFRGSESTMAITYGSGEDVDRWYEEYGPANESMALATIQTFFPNSEYWHQVDGVLVLPAPLTHRSKARQRQTDEERLTSILFRNYASSLRPVYNSSEAVHVQFGINLIHLANIDEVNQVLEISVWMEMIWRDERLKWDPLQFSGLKMIRLPTRLIWVPDIVLYNSADDFDRRTKAEEVRAMIGHTGDIFLGPYVKLRSTCILDLTLYPYDEQKCALVFGSWTYDSSQLIVRSKADSVELSQYIESAKWELLESSVVHAERKHSCCKAPYSDIVITIKTRRRFLYNNLFNIFIPTIWLSFLCLLCFYLAPESGEKVTLGITVLLTFTLFTWMVAENTPRTSDFIPLISIYLTVTMSLSAVVVGLQVFMLNVHGMTPVLRPVPNLLRVVVIDCIARWLHIENLHKLGGSGDNKKRRRVKKTLTWQTTWGKQPALKEKPKDKILRKIRQKAQQLFGSQSYYLGQQQQQQQNQPRDTSNQSRWPAEGFSDEVVDEQFDNIMNEILSTSRLRFIAREARFFDAVDRVVIGDNEQPYYYNNSSDNPVPSAKSSSVKKSISQPVRISQTAASRIRTTSSSTNNAEPSHVMTVAERVEDELLLRLTKAVTYMSKHEQSEALTNEIINEWRLLAVVFDRLAFWFFFIFTLLTTFGLLVLVPLTQKEYPKRMQGYIGTSPTINDFGIIEVVYDRNVTANYYESYS